MKTAVALTIASLLLLAGCGASDYRDPSGTVSVPVDVDTFSIRVGDCVGKLETDSTNHLELVPCAQEHFWQAYWAGQLDGDEYPGNAAVQKHAEQLCTAELEGFLGLPAERSKFEIRFLMPTKDTWRQQDRAVTCLVGSASGGITGSLAGVAE